MRQALQTGVLVVIAATVAGACSAPVKEPEHSGFLSDYSKLEQIDDHYFFYSSGRTGSYSTFIVDTPVMLYRRPSEEDRVFTDEELQELIDFVKTTTEEKLSEDDGYAIVSEPGPGVARLRVAITDLDDTTGILNITIYTKITGAGLGGVAAEGELVDSVTGEQLAAGIRWGSGSRILRAGYTKSGDAKILIKRWAKDLRKRIDKAHGL